MEKEDCVLVLGCRRRKHASVLPPFLPRDGSLLKRGWGEVAFKLNLFGARAPSLGRVGSSALRRGRPPLRAPGRWGWGSRPQGTARRRWGKGWGRRARPRSGWPSPAGRETTPAARRPAEARARRDSRWRCAPRCWTGSQGWTPQHSSRASVLHGEGRLVCRG